MFDIQVFRETLVSLRKSRGLSQAKAAALIGRGQSSIAHYETGMAMPRIDELHKLADLYQVPLGFLLGEPSTGHQPSLPTSHPDHLNSSHNMNDKTMDYPEIALRPVQKFLIPLIRADQLDEFSNKFHNPQFIKMLNNFELLIDTEPTGTKLAIEVPDDKMDDTLKQSSVCIVRVLSEKEWRGIDAGLYVVIARQKTMIRRLIERNWREGYLRLYCDNKRYGYEDFGTEEIQMIYKVIMSINYYGE